MGDELAELKAEVAKLKASQPTVIDHDAARAHRNAIHQASEARMSRASAFSRDQLAAMAAACPDDVVKGIVRDARAPTGPSGAGVSGQVAKVSANPGLLGSNTGWQEPRPIGPPPGIAHVDRLIDAQDRRDFAERVHERVELDKRMLKALGKR